MAKNQEEGVAQVSTQEVAEVQTIIENEGKERIVGYDELIKKLIADGWKRRNNLKVKNVNSTDKENYTMVTFTIVPPIPGYVYDEENDTYKLDMVKTVFTSNFSLAGCVKENEELAFLGNTIVERPKAINMLFNGGTIDVISKEVKANEDYINPFSQDAEPVQFEHDTIINIVVRATLGKNGLEVVKEMRRAFAESLIA